MNTNEMLSNENVSYLIKNELFNFVFFQINKKKHYYLPKMRILIHLISIIFYLNLFKKICWVFNVIIS